MVLPLALRAAGVIGVLGLMVLAFRAASFRRRTGSEVHPIQDITASPLSISAAVAARLTGSRFAFLGALFDLTARGVLLIEEGPKKWGRRTFTILRQSDGGCLQSYEQIFIDALFPKTGYDPVPLSTISLLAYNYPFIQALDQALSAAGWRDTQRLQRRHRFLSLSGMDMGVGMAVLSVGLLLVGKLTLLTNPWAVILGTVLTGAGAAESVVGLAGLCAAGLISPLSDEGLRHASYLKSFNGYLRDITHSRVTQVMPGIFERYLPYAAGFGMATEWAEYFQKVVDIPVPAWFRGWHSSLEEDMTTATIAAIAAVDSSAGEAAS